MKRGTIVLAALIALVLALFLQIKNSDNNDPITSLITAADNKITSFAVGEDDTVGINVDLFPLSREIRPGDDVRVDTRIDTHDDEIVDVTISYAITNNKGMVVFQKSKTLAVERTAKVMDNLMIHRTLDPGPYLVEVEINYGNVRKVEKDTFNVIKVPVEVTFGNKEAVLLLIMLIMLTIFFVLLWIQNRRVNKILKEHEKADIEHIVR